MKDINKEFRFFRKKDQEDTNEKEDANGLIVRRSFPILEIDNKGNIIKDENSKCCLVSSMYDCKGLSKDYFGIKHIRKDYYVVLDTHYTQLKENNAIDNIKLELKFGIIKTRDYDGRINFQQEEVVAPIAYDRIYIYDDDYPIMEKDGKYTYFCLDEKSKNHLEQLTPLVLDAAYPFNIKYPGFAECVINGKTRFIPIDFIARENITEDDLLTEEEIIQLINIYDTFNKLQQTTKSEVPKLVKKLQK